MKAIASLRCVSSVTRRYLFSEAFFGFGIGIWNIALNFHYRMHGLDEVTISALLGVAFFATAITAFFCGRLGDGIGFPKVMGIGGILVGIALVLNAVAGQLFLFVLAQIIYGMGLSCIVSMEYPQLLSYVEKAQSGFAYNAAIMVYFLSSVLGNLFAGVFADLSDLQNPYQTLLLISAAMYFVLGVTRGQMPRQRVVTPPKMRIVTVLRQRDVLSYLLFGFVTMVIFNGVMSMLNLILREWHGLSDMVIGGVFAAGSVLGGCVVMLLPPLQNRFGNERLALWFMLAQAAGIMLLSVSGALMTAMLICVRNMATNCIYSTVDRPMLQSIAPDRQGSYSGLRASANYVGMSLGVLLSGAFVAQGNYAMLFLSVGMIGLVQCAIYRFVCVPKIRAGLAAQETAQSDTLAEVTQSS